MPKIKFLTDYATYKKDDVADIYSELASAIVHQEAAAEYVIEAESPLLATAEIATPAKVLVAKSAPKKKK
jgi:hypothetical protein